MTQGSYLTRKQEKYIGFRMDGFEASPFRLLKNYSWLLAHTFMIKRSICRLMGNYPVGYHII